MYEERGSSIYTGYGLLHKVYRVYDGFFRIWNLYRLLSMVDRFIVEYYIDGYTYFHVYIDRGSDESRILDILLEDIDLEEADNDQFYNCYEEIEVRSSHLTEDFIKPSDLGYLILVDSRLTMDDNDVIVGYGLYRFKPCREKIDYNDLKPKYSMYLRDLSRLVNRLLGYTSYARPSKTETPLKLRKGDIHMDGCIQRLKGYYLRIPDISLDIPLDHHIFLLGKTRSGKSVSIADICRYIVENGIGKVLIFDWIGNFLSLRDMVRDSIIVRPGEDIQLDLFKVFDKSVLPEVYEESSQLFFRDIRHASFTPAVYEKLNEGIEKSGNHLQLIMNLREMKRLSKREDDRNAISALLRRIGSLDPTLYISLDSEDSLLKILDGYNLVVIDLSNIMGEWDKILFTLIALKTLQMHWNSLKPKLYIVLDEAHRLAPRNKVREWTLNRLSREGLKYNIHLILADQTLMNISEDIWGNMGYKIVFNIDNPKDVEKISIYLQSDSKERKVYNEILIETLKILKLRPGECILINQYNNKPVECYFKPLKLTNTGEVERIDYNKIMKIARELGLKMNREEDYRTIIKARRIIRKYSDGELLRKFKEFYCLNRIKTLEIDKITLAIRDKNTVKLRKTLQIYMKYYSLFMPLQ